MSAWDDSFTGGAFDAFYDTVSAKPCTDMQRDIECEIDRVGTGGALAAHLVSRVICDATERDTPTLQRAVRSDATARWKHAASSRQLTGGEFWTVLQKLAQGAWRGGGTNTVRHGLHAPFICRLSYYNLISCRCGLF